MNEELYEDLVDLDEEMELDEEEFDEEEEDEEELYDESEIDDMLEGLMDEAAEEEDLAERRRRRRKARAKARRRRARRKPVPRATGRPALRVATRRGLVTRQEFAQLGMNVRRNAAGIKTLTTRVRAVNTRVNGVVTVNRAQSRAIGGIDRRMKVAGALELAEALGPGGINVFQLLKGAAVSGVLPQGKGALSNPWVIGGIGLVLNNPGLLSGITPQIGPTP